MKKIAIVLFSVIFIACKNTEIQAKKEVMIEKERIPVTTITLSKERIEDKKNHQEKYYIDKIYTTPKPDTIVKASEMKYVEYLF